MELDIFSLPAFEDNYIWCLRRDNRIAVVDPGDANPVFAHLASTGQELAAILVTHHHGDHTGGIAELTRKLPVPVLGPGKENIPGITLPVADGDRISIPGIDIDFQVLDVAGHTRGHVAYYRRGILFCGDTLFACGCGRLFEGTANQLYETLHRIAALPPETLIYCAHEYTASGITFAAAVEPGNPALADRALRVTDALGCGKSTVPFTLAEELATNPFLRCHMREVMRAAEQFANRPVSTPTDVFATLRKWRDDFRPVKH